MHFQQNIKKYTLTMFRDNLQQVLFEHWTYPESLVRYHQSTLRNIPEERNLIYIAAEAWNHAQLKGDVTKIVTFYNSASVLWKLKRHEFRLARHNNRSVGWHTVVDWILKIFQLSQKPYSHSILRIFVL